MKKIISVLLALVICFCFSGLSASALTSGDFEYSVSGDTASITKYNGNAESVTIPSALGGKRVTSVGGYAFMGKDKLKSVTFPASLRSLSNCAFADCVNLSEVNFASGLTTISTGAFLNCKSITQFSLPSTVKTINAGAFEGCSGITEFYVPSKVASLKANTFMGCTNLKSITVGEGVTEIDPLAFDGISLNEFKVNENSTRYKAKSGVLFTFDDDTLVAYPTGKSATSYSVPSGTANISERAFYNAENLTAVSLPSSVMTVGAKAFYGTPVYNNSGNAFYLSKCLIEVKYNPASFTIKSDTRVIADGAFKNCNRLSTVSIPASVKSVGKGVFAGCTSLGSISAPSNTVYKVSSGVLLSKDGSRIIAYPPAKSGDTYSIPSTVTYIGQYSFATAQNLTELNIPATVETVDNYAFFSTSLKSVRIESVNIGNYAFAYSNLKHVRLTEKVAYVFARAFFGCDNLKSLHIEGNGLEKIGEYAFGFYIKDNTQNTKVEGFTIFNSTSYVAHDYATENSFDERSDDLIRLSTPTYVGGGITVNWQQDSGATGYRVYKKGPTQWDKINDKTSDTFFKDSSALDYTNYLYTARAYYSYGTKTVWGEINREGIGAYRIGIPKISERNYSEEGISFSWTPVKEAEGYRLYRIENGEFTRLADSTTLCEFSDTSAKQNTLYNYAVRGYKILNGATHWGDYEVGYASYLMPSPTLSAEVTKYNQITLDWDKIEKVTGYVIYRNGIEIAENYRASNLGFTDNDVVAGREYTYKIRAYKSTADGKQYGLFSEEITLTPLPLAPSGFEVTVNGHNSVSIDWQKQAGVTGYAVYRSEGGAFTRISTNKRASNLGFTDTSVLAGKEYTYRVRAYKYADGKNNYGAYTEKVTVTPLPKKVTGLTLKRQTSETITLGWDKISGVTGYAVYISQDGKSFTRAATNKGASNYSATISVAGYSDECYVRVRAYKHIEGKNHYGTYSSKKKVYLYD